MSFVLVSSASSTYFWTPVGGKKSRRAFPSKRKWDSPWICVRFTLPLQAVHALNESITLINRIIRNSQMCLDYTRIHHDLNRPILCSVFLLFGPVTLAWPQHCCWQESVHAVLCHSFLPPPPSTQHVIKEEGKDPSPLKNSILFSLAMQRSINTDHLFLLI